MAKRESAKRFFKNQVSSNVAGGTIMQYGMGLLGGRWQPKYLLGSLAENMLEEQLIGLGGGLGKKAFWGLQLAQLGFATGSMVNTAAHTMKGNQMEWLGRNLGGNFKDTQQAYTMRQQAIETMKRTGLDVRQTLGSEASFMHRGSYY